ncbi:MAG: hypothetical protein L0312_01250 [Acidobacteria bacterium]|nr:hypothetical protein [Acidobacteriota bacterium]
MSEEKSRKRKVKKAVVDSQPDVTPAARGKQEPQKDDPSAIEPFSQMFQFYDSFAKSWSDAMSKAVSSKSFAESMGRQIENNLDTMTLMRRQMGDLIEQYLQQMSLPTRNDVINLSERLTNLEMSVDDLDAKLDELLRLLKEKK